MDALYIDVKSVAVSKLLDTAVTSVIILSSTTGVAFPSGIDVSTTLFTNVLLITNGAVLVDIIVDIDFAISTTGIVVDVAMILTIVAIFTAALAMDVLFVAK